MNLREIHKTATTKGEHPIVQVGDVVVMEKGKLTRGQAGG